MSDEFKTITREELKQKMDRGDRFALVETLAEAAYAQRHLPGAVNIPPERLNELAPVILPDKNAEIIVYCSSPTWHASDNAARALVAKGYTNITDYAGGKSDWIDAGFPVETQNT